MASAIQPSFLFTNPRAIKQSTFEGSTRRAASKSCSAASISPAFNRHVPLLHSASALSGATASAPVKLSAASSYLIAA
jgi:hypothetical protein